MNFDQRKKGKAVIKKSRLDCQSPKIDIIFKAMTIKLNIREDNFIKLCLFSSKHEIDCLEWQNRNDLSRKLLANLDKILKKNDVTLDKIINYNIISEVPRKWTTYRIADIAFQTLKIGKLARKNIVC